MVVFVRTTLSPTCHQVLTGLRPFHRLGPYTVVIAVQKGERPGKPDNAGALGFSNTLWGLTRTCWDESPSARPTAQQLLRYLEDASHTWVPPLEYPILDSPDWGVGLGLPSSGERYIVMSALTSNVFVLLMSVLCISLCIHYCSHLFE